MPARETMVPLEADTLRPWIWDDAPAEAGRRAVALGHALLYRRDTLWGDSPRGPKSVVMLREGDLGWEAVAAGEPEPAVAWLVGRVSPGPASLLAPKSWRRPVERLVGRGKLSAGEIETWGPGRGGSSPPMPTAEDESDRRRLRPAVHVRRLVPGDASAFAAFTPSWALRGWASFEQMTRHAAAFGVPLGGGFATLAWVVEQDVRHASIGVFTWPRYRRLGLGYAAAAALMVAVVRETGRVPIWVAAAEDGPSKTLAASLGLAPLGEEALLRWPETAAPGA